MHFYSFNLNIQQTFSILSLYQLLDSSTFFTSLWEEFIKRLNDSDKNSSNQTSISCIKNIENISNKQPNDIIDEKYHFKYMLNSLRCNSIHLDCNSNYY